MPPPATAAPAPVPGPATPRPGDVSDLTGAIYRMPQIQALARRAQDRVQHDLTLFGREWTAASGGQHFAMVTMGVAVAGGMIAPILANQPTRQLAFGLIRGRDIPLPLLPGWSFRILDNGGGVKVPLGNPAVTLDARLQLPGGSAPPDYAATVTVDVAALVRGLR